MVKAVFAVNRPEVSNFVDMLAASPCGFGRAALAFSAESLAGRQDEPYRVVDVGFGRVSAQAEAERAIEDFFRAAHCLEYRRGFARSAGTSRPGGAGDAGHVEGHKESLPVEGDEGDVRYVCKAGGVLAVNN